MHMIDQSVYIDRTAVVDEGCRVGAGTHIWHFSHLMDGCCIGANCNIGQNVFVASDVLIGNGVKIQNNVSIYAGVQLEDDVFIGPSAVFTNVKNPRSPICRKHEYLRTIVRKGATIGANATVVCGHEIGAYALVGAGAVVACDVPAFALMVGNPAQRAGWVSRHGERLNFDANGEAVCPVTNEQYRLKDGCVSLIK